MNSDILYSIAYIVINIKLILQPLTDCDLQLEKHRLKEVKLITPNPRAP